MLGDGRKDIRGFGQGEIVRLGRTIQFSLSVGVGGSVGQGGTRHSQKNAVQNEADSDKERDQPQGGKEE
jgi:hypothetical protein